MIAVCTKCHKAFDATQEEAYTPGVLCVSCYHAEKRQEAAQRGETYTVPAWVQLEKTTEENVHHD